MAGTLRVGGKVLATHNSETDLVSWGAGVPTGAVLNIVHTAIKTSHELTTPGSGNFADIKNGDSGDITLAATITLKSPNNKILIFGYVSCSNVNELEHTAIRVVRGNSASSSSNDTSTSIVGVGDNIGSRGRATTAHHTPYAINRSIVAPINTVDQPGTIGPHIYKVQFYSGSSNFYLNRNEAYTDSDHYMTGQSCITLMEISA
jgi:hypothetical protein